MKGGTIYFSAAFNRIMTNPGNANDLAFLQILFPGLLNRPAIFARKFFTPVLNPAGGDPIIDLLTFLRNPATPLPTMPLTFVDAYSSLRPSDRRNFLNTLRASILARSGALHPGGSYRSHYGALTLFIEVYTRLCTLNYDAPAQQIFNVLNAPNLQPRDPPGHEPFAAPVVPPLPPNMPVDMADTMIPTVNSLRFWEGIPARFPLGAAVLPPDLVAFIRSVRTASDAYTQAQLVAAAARAAAVEAARVLQEAADQAAAAAAAAAAEQEAAAAAAVAPKSAEMLSMLVKLGEYKAEKDFARKNIKYGEMVRGISAALTAESHVSPEREPNITTFNTSLTTLNAQNNECMASRNFAGSNRACDEIRTTLEDVFKFFGVKDVKFGGYKKTKKNKKNKKTKKYKSKKTNIESVRG